MIDARFAVEVVSWLVEDHGIRYVRLTGGEPLLHPELISIIDSLSRLELLREISLTTNAQALSRMAVPLSQAGLLRINISLDTLDPKRFKRLTRGGVLEHTLRGIEAAVAADLSPVRINVVAQRGLNEHEYVDLVAWGLSRGCTVRFLEVMPIGPLSHIMNSHLVSASEIRERLSTRFALRPISQPPGQPSVDYAVDDGTVHGVIGIIAPTTEPFCDRCRRMRVTSHGLLVACLHDNRHFDVMRHWDGQRLNRSAASPILHEAVQQKPAEGRASQSLTMLSIGG